MVGAGEAASAGGGGERDCVRPVPCRGSGRLRQGGRGPEGPGSVSLGRRRGREQARLRAGVGAGGKPTSQHPNPIPQTLNPKP
jgi:hypothetical protein